MTNFFVGQRSIGQSRVGTLGISVVKSDTRAKNLSDYFCFVCCQYHSTSAPCSYFIRHGRYVNLASDIFFIWHRYTRHRMGCLISSVIFSSGDAYSMFLRDVVAVYQRTLRHTREDPIWYWLRWELIISVWPLNLFRQGLLLYVFTERRYIPAPHTSSWSQLATSCVPIHSPRLSPH